MGASGLDEGVGDGAGLEPDVDPGVDAPDGWAGGGEVVSDGMGMKGGGGGSAIGVAGTGITGILALGGGKGAPAGILVRLGWVTGLLGATGGS